MSSGALLGAALLLLGSAPQSAEQARDPYDLIGTENAELSPVGAFDLWEDYEGGTVCSVYLTANRVIGGYGIDYDPACIARLEIDGDIAAWFPTDDGFIVMIDDTRKALIRMHTLPDGDYYVVRQSEGKANLNLTRPQ